ncbi:S8 family serine peptidase [Dyadobacter fanqingshengii]|uniref:S8 family peptidase n=1 Tax=Dyadobacter fanqingshengii TaxID=2906443 RepID=A0A9X1P972_9BACT|nr:S8 family serine peptidase [Dyadobacter fanqingshengii]MCF0038985.1 S8 family peptidase [Dyadobacter fanqingshengii]USJ34193.1 S8 family peptidase [Dyadobacter fanqingshengii]
MMKKLFLMLFLATQVATAQDANYLKNGVNYPIWFSKTKLLIKFKDRTKSNDLYPELFSNRIKRTEIIHSIPDMAYVVFDSSTSIIELQNAVAKLRTDENIKSAQPMLVSENGEETAGLTDLVIARPKREVPTEDVLSAFRKYNLMVDEEDKDSEINYYLSGGLVSNNPFEACEKLDATGLFEFTQPNYLRFIELAGNPNDPLFASNWGLAKMKLPEAWDITTGCSNIKIAIIDDGVQLNHPDLQPNLLPGFDATQYGTNGGTVAGEEQHGTKCAGFAAAKGNNGIGIAGVAYNSKIIPIRAFGTKPDGNLRTETLDSYVASAINHAINQKNADILNMSWGIIASISPVNQNPVIEAALINAAVNGRGGKGAVLITSSGNKGQNYLAPLPGNVKDVFVVGASKSNDTRWEGSNGPTHRIDVAAPGAYITTKDLSAYNNQPAENATSWAAPAVAGIAALVLSVNPNLTQLQVRKIIAETCDKVGGYNYVVGNGSTFSDLSHNNDLGYGRVNALRAVEKAAGAPITGPALICVNGGYSLTAFPSGSSAVWSASAGLKMAGTLATRQAGYNGAGTIFTTLTIPNACAPITIKRSIWVGNPNINKTVNGVVTGTTSVNAGELYNLAATSTSPSTTFNYNNYAGSGDMAIDLYSPNSSNTQMYVLGNSTNGYRKVKLTATNSCGNYAEDFVFSLSGMFKVYPNPATDILTLEWFTEDGRSVPEQIQLFNENSEKPERVVSVKKMLAEQNSKSRISITVGDLPRGIYFLHIISGRGADKQVEKVRILLN